MRKKSSRKPNHVNPWAFQNAIRLNSPFSTEEARLISYQGWDSFDLLLTGKGTQEDLQAMESMASVLHVVSKSLPDVVAVADKAIAAAHRGKTREKSGLDGEGIQACRESLHYFDDLLAVVKRGDFMKALEKVQKERAKYASNEVVAGQP